MRRRGSYSASVALPETLLPGEPRRELREGVTGLDFAVGEVKLRAGDLPLFRRVDGKLRQCLRVVASGPARLAVVAGDRQLDAAAVEGGGGRALLFVPAVERPQTVELEIELPSGERVRQLVALQPQRRWRVFLVHHSHLDIGYTDPQPQVLRHHLSYLDSALDLAAADDTFRWTVECNLPLERWLAGRPAAARAELLGRIRSGQVEVCALPFTTHAEALSIDELARQLRFADELRERHGVEVVSAMQTDVPGAPPGLAAVLADAGVRYLAVAHNWAGRAVPHLTGGDILPRSFHWQTESGKRVLVWHTDSPHGAAYLEGNLLGLAESYETAAELVPEYLAALASRPYPYRSEALGSPADAEFARHPYPLDVLHLRVQGLIADNAAPSPVPAQIARAWNAEFAYPRLLPAANRDFFEALPADELDTFTGDWADWWADGLASGARAIGFNRRAQAAIRAAQTLHVLADAATGADGDHTAEVDRTYESMALFDEHTWGAAEPRGDAAGGRDSGALQWQAKAALAVDALGRAEALVEAAAARFATSERRPSVLVLNSSGSARTDVVSVFLPASRVASGLAAAVVDAETGRPVRSFVGPAQTARNRPQGTVLSFLADNVPAVGYRRYDLVTGSGPAPRDVEALENEHYSLELDIEGGYGLEVVDRELDLDLVADGDFGLGQIVHDRYEGPLRATMRLPPGGAPATGGGRPSRGALIGSRTVPRQGVVVERTGNELEDRVTVRLAGPGFEWIETTYRLLHGVRRLDVTHRFSKRATLAKESVYVVFPFALRDPSVDYELTGGVGGHASVPGSAEHFHAIRHWVALQDETATVAWSTLEAPLVQLGNIFLPYPPYPPTIDSPGGGTVVSWAMNNVWDTNFPPSQGGETALSYAIASAPAAADARALGIATAAALTHPLIGVLGGEASTPAGGLCELDRDDVELVMLAQSTRGHDFVVHLQSYASREVTVRIGFPGLHVARVLAGTSGERDLREAPDALVHMGPGDYATVAVDLERRGT